MESFQPGRKGRAKKAKAKRKRGGAEEDGRAPRRQPDAPRTERETRELALAALARVMDEYHSDYLRQKRDMQPLLEDPMFAEYNAAADYIAKHRNPTTYASGTPEYTDWWSAHHTMDRTKQALVARHRGLIANTNPWGDLAWDQPVEPKNTHKKIQASEAREMDAAMRMLRKANR